METTDMVPFTIPTTTAPARQTEYRDAIIEASHLAQKVGWGSDGSIQHMVEEVRSQQVWLDPNFPIQFTDQQLEVARNSLLGGQNKAFKVVKVPNPKKMAESHDGTTDQNLLISDIDGALIFMAGTSLDWFLVEVEEYKGNYYELLLNQVQSKTQQYTMTRLDKGRLYIRAFEAYQAELMWREQHKEAKPKAFPTYATLAPDFGCASGSDLQLCERMVRLDETILKLFAEGKLTEDNVREIAGLPEKDQLPAALEAAATFEQTGKPAARSEVRAATARRATGRTPAPEQAQISWQDLQQQIRVDDLWLPQTVGPEYVAMPVILGRALHDIACCVSTDATQFPKEAKALLKRLQTLVEDKTIQTLIASVALNNAEHY